MKNNVKAPIRATEDSQNNQTDGGALCDASCSASSFDGLTLDEKKTLWKNLTLELGSKENRSQCDDIKKLAYDFKWLLWDDYTPNEIKSLSVFGEF